MNYEAGAMDSKKMRAIATDIERVMKAHKPNCDEAIVVCISLACACIVALALSNLDGSADELITELRAVLNDKENKQ